MAYSNFSIYVEAATYFKVYAGKWEFDLTVTWQRLIINHLVEIKCLEDAGTKVGG